MASYIGIPHDNSALYYLNSSHVEIHCGGPAGENVASFYWKLALGLGFSFCTIYMCGYIAISKSIKTLADSFQHTDPIDDELAEEEGRTRPKPSRPICSSGPSDSTSGCCGDEGVRPRSDFWRRIRQFLVRPDGWVMVIMNYAVAMAASGAFGASMQISLPQPVSEPTV